MKIDYVYDSNNDILLIRNFLNTQQQISLHSYLVESSKIAMKIGKSFEDGFTINLDPNLNIDSKIIHNISTIINSHLTSLRKNKNTNIINRLDFEYSDILCVRYPVDSTYDNNKWKLKKRKRDKLLMDWHYDEWSSNNITISLGHSALFSYYNINDDGKINTISINSGDLVSFNGNLVYHKVDTNIKIEPPEWFKLLESNNIYRYNLQFTQKDISKKQKIINNDNKENINEDIKEDIIDEIYDKMKNLDNKYELLILLVKLFIKYDFLDPNISDKLIKLTHNLDTSISNIIDSIPNDNCFKLKSELAIMKNNLNDDSACDYIQKHNYDLLIDLIDLKDINKDKSISDPNHHTTNNDKNNSTNNDKNDSSNFIMKFFGFTSYQNK